MLNKLHIATYNIHKGFSHFNRRVMVHQLRDSLRALNADIIFLQEVVGEHKGHGARFENWSKIARPSWPLMSTPGNRTTAWL